MITNSPFIQLFMVLLAGAILLLYIQPTITAIRATQDEVAVYQNELDRVTNVNSLLTEHAEKINLLPLSDIQALERYLPTTIDEIAVMRDLQLLTEEVGVTLTSLEYGGSGATQTGGDADTTVSPDTPVQSLFNLSVEGSYQDIKRLLSAIEVNDYQLTVNSADLSPEDNNRVTANLALVAYSLQKPVDSAVAGEEGSE
jgi:hypothetical protein